MKPYRHGLHPRKKHDDRDETPKHEFDEEFLNLLKRLLRALLSSQKPPDSLRVIVGPAARKGSTRMVQARITNEQKIPLKIAPKTAKGVPVAVDGPPSWSRVDGDDSIGTLGSVSEDGLSVDFISTDGGAGVCTVDVSVDADLGSGMRTISERFEISVVTPEAENLNAEVGTAILK